MSCTCSALSSLATCTSRQNPDLVLEARRIGLYAMELRRERMVDWEPIPARSPKEEGLGSSERNVRGAPAAASCGERSPALGSFPQVAHIFRRLSSCAPSEGKLFPEHALRDVYREARESSRASRCG